MDNDVFIKLTEKLKAPNSTYLLRILRLTITPEEGELLLELPASTSELATKLHRNEDDIKQSMASLLKRGLLMGSPQGLMLPKNRIMLHHTSLSTLAEISNPEVTKIWKDWYDAEWAKEASTFWIGSEGPRLRIIPVSKSLDAFAKVSSSEILPYEDPRKIIERAKTIAVVDCACRRTMMNCDHPLDVCLHFDQRADFAIARPSGKKLSVDEALAVLDYAEEKGLLPSVDNVTSPFGAICFCCASACVVINSAMRYGTLTKQLAKSRFQAEINDSACTGCQICVKRCQFGAITMEPIPGTKKRLKARINIEKCWGCGQCTLKCKPEAIRLKLVRPIEYIPVGTQSGPTFIM
jgi:Na+-translocating ferredoxin:NAD+ oxidoreductase subunit B